MRHISFSFKNSICQILKDEIDIVDNVGIRFTLFSMVTCIFYFFTAVLWFLQSSGKTLIYRSLEWNFLIVLALIVARKAI
jgi:hypothetical protein